MTNNKRKDKALMISGISLGVLVGLFIIARLTHSLEMYSIPTQANEPAIKKGSHIWASAFIKPSPGCFIIFKRYDSTMQEETPFVYRCVGMPGDVLEMRNSVLYVNGKNADEKLTLKKMYTLYSKNPEPFLEMTSEKEEYEDLGAFPNVQLFLTPEQLNKLKSICKPGEDSIVKTKIVYPINQPGQFMYELGKGKWTIDDLGPLKVPFDHYFALGDNRHNAFDSRFTGFIPAEKVIGVALHK